MSYSRSRVREWDDDKESCWSRRSGLERKLIVVLIVIATLSAGFVIYFFVVHKATPTICSTPSCLLAASHIITHIDPDTDPCEDFFQFSCGNFIKNSHGDAKAADKFEIEELLERQLTEIVQEPIQNDDHPLVKKQKLFFAACMNESAIEEETLDFFKDTIKELNGWPVVVGYRWKARLFDWEDMIYELRERGYEDHFLLLGVSLTTNPENSNEYIVEILQPMLKTIKEEHKKLYKQFMTDVVISFGAEKNLAYIEMGLVLEFMEKLEKIASEYILWEAENLTEANMTQEFLSRKILLNNTIEELQEEHNEMDWLEFINTILSPTASVSSDDYVIFPNCEYLDAFFRLLRKTPKRTQANFIIWRVLEAIMPYMPKELKQLEANYTCLTNTSSPPKHRVKFCTELVQSSYLLSPLNVIYERKYLPTEKKLQVEEIMENIKSELKRSLLEATWMDEESKDNVGNKIDDIINVVGFSEDYFNDTVFDMLNISNETLEEDGDENDDDDYMFLKMLLKNKKRTFDTLYSLLKVPVNETRVFGSLRRSPTVIYVQRYNLVKIDSRFLQGIFYDEDRPMYMNYGAIGSKIGREMAKAVDTEETEIYENGLEQSNKLLSKKSIAAFNEQTKCFVKNESNEFLQKKVILNTVGVKISHSAYKSWLQDQEPEYLPGVDYTPEQMFWISAMLPYCYKIEEDMNLDLEAEVFRTGAPMRNNFEFAQDFSCSEESAMNAKVKCEIF